MDFPKPHNELPQPARPSVDTSFLFKPQKRDNPQSSDIPKQEVVQKLLKEVSTRFIDEFNSMLDTYKNVLGQINQSYHQILHIQQLHAELQRTADISSRADGIKAEPVGLSDDEREIITQLYKGIEKRKKDLEGFADAARQKENEVKNLPTIFHNSILKGEIEESEVKYCQHTVLEILDIDGFIQRNHQRIDDIDGIKVMCRAIFNEGMDKDIDEAQEDEP